jgi:hypothetical protein
VVEIYLNLSMHLAYGFWNMLKVGNLLIPHINTNYNLLLEIVGKYGVVCLERGGKDLTVAIKANPVLEKHSKNIFIFRDVLNDISATHVR